MQEKFASISEHVACRTIDGEARIISVRDSRLHQLDPVATFIWEQLEQGRGGFGTLLDEIVGNFEVEQAQAALDLEELLGELERLGLVTLHRASEDG